MGRTVLNLKDPSLGHKLSSKALSSLFKALDLSSNETKEEEGGRRGELILLHHWPGVNILLHHWAGVNSRGRSSWLTPGACHIPQEKSRQLLKIPRAGPREAERMMEGFAC